MEITKCFWLICFIIKSAPALLRYFLSYQFYLLYNMKWQLNNCCMRMNKKLWVFNGYFVFKKVVSSWNLHPKQDSRYSQDHRRPRNPKNCKVALWSKSPRLTKLLLKIPKYSKDSTAERACRDSLHRQPAQTAYRKVSK